MCAHGTCLRAAGVAPQPTAAGLQHSTCTLVPAGALLATRALCAACPPPPKVADLEVMEGRRDAELPRCLLGVESDRLRFLLKAYLRARLAKIQASAGERGAAPGRAVVRVRCECVRVSVCV